MDVSREFLCAPSLAWEISKSEATWVCEMTRGEIDLQQSEDRTNHDDIPHGIASSDKAFKRSKALDTDDSYSFTFTTPGTYQYFCYLHPHMVGSIVVESTTGSNAAK